MLYLATAFLGGLTTAIASNVDTIAGATGTTPLLAACLAFFFVVSVALYLYRDSVATMLKPAPKKLNWKPRQLVKEVDGRDENTPDAWIKRDPSLIRLTGRHPFNCEPPLKDLMDAGFITPTRIHFVRNHGKVPKISYENHRVSVVGLVNKPLNLTMDEIVSLPSHEFPLTFPCAGNRRKEENMVKKGLGFSWGAAAHATSVWKGVRLSTVLKKAGVKEGAKFVCFRGPLKELPKGKDGSYGTSIAIDRAMQDNWDVILAYEQNGQPLSPDHGFPLRIIIPGFIGGRMVKWLSHIEVSDKESQNHFHFYDNRVLPSEVTAEKANAEDWWHNPDFIINDINIQSAIRSPEHAEVVTSEPGSYTVKGYAYGGGGRKIIRCEVSIDLGVTWIPAKIQRFEEEWYKRHGRTQANFDSRGRHWCWVHWSVELEKKVLCGSPEIRCRAWDSDHNTQPLHISWNVMGMLNNSCYRLRIHPCQDAKGNDAVWFEVPTLAGPQPGGWMVPDDEVRPAAMYASLGGVDPRKVPDQKYSLEQIRAINNTTSQKLLVIDNLVFDCSEVLRSEPPLGIHIRIGGTTKNQDFCGLSREQERLLTSKYQGGKLPCCGSFSG
mmetsp:Transcript_14569/g.20370  ORF Transcript_14569/g.20370 Transcript_14569/m.20370 type:complete len:606 (+) Transcript_14569:332-2149(+)|eukprot:CAMPEP_0184481072 /NCGR_PEP_ID=MMETSP0113_2-20130426/2605_1 /TAXON_ID=91329 /ORGANISM="Norrisiella sphaerica, Strain BC52" /LENGTH=605 /DNA_ID=CAMNT_0026859973 /DNA_START=325 /DNA_END=2142 /DNA_ORIENTATION=-